MAGIKSSHYFLCTLLLVPARQPHPVSLLSKNAILMLWLRVYIKAHQVIEKIDIGKRFKKILQFEDAGFHNEGGPCEKIRVVLKQISVKITDMLTPIFPVWFSII